MKIRSFGIIVLALVLGTVLTGCGCFMQAQKGEEAPPPPPEVQAVAPEEAKVETPVASEPAPAPEAVMLKSINFDFDRYNIRPGDEAILKENEGWFKANPGKNVKIEGHCDERGTVEYNLVLGQKRADATKNYLVNLGIDDKILETVSYGKERPIDPRHKEEAWAKNRRANIVPVQ
ncbi:MAG: peptidoglycan-associated lipoprotein Pal [Syntrophobacterales bacterium]|jgi:peptidoglycan-associated lipoprotein|nr:peptidoglycan-associated lipoprotein Pal [Syntrophobacterales bacterium]